MDREMNEMAYIITGVIIGVLLMRYGIGLGYKMCYQAKEDEPLRIPKDLPIDQENTEEEDDDDYNSQEETEVL